MRKESRNAVHVVTLCLLFTVSALAQPASPSPSAEPPRFGEPAGPYEIPLPPESISVENARKSTPREVSSEAIATDVLSVTNYAVINTTTGTNSALTLNSNQPYLQILGVGTSSPMLTLSTGTTLRSYLGAAGANDVGIWGTLPGDIFLRSNNTNLLFSADSGNNAHMRITSGGRVVVGQTSYDPLMTMANFHVAGTSIFGGEGNSSGKPRLVLGAAQNDFGVIGYNALPTDTWNSFKYLVNDPASLVYFDNGGIRFRTAPLGTAGQPIAFAEPMTILPNGNVGIGYPVPGYKLHVNGSAHFDGAVTGTNIRAHFQDVAEWVPAAEKLSPGTVVILDKRTNNTVTASKSAYDSSVAGVVSLQPGISLGEEGPNKVQVATTGRVRVRVDASRGAVAIGDLLVTSDVAGTAMRSEPMEINGRRFHQPGTLIGKALEPLASGAAEILVLLSMQ